MPKISFQTTPAVANNSALLKEELKQQLGLKESDIIYFNIEKKSIDARNRNIKINLTISYSVNEELLLEKIHFNYKDVSSAPQNCYIIGAGPGGLFAALRCIELGIKPIIIERGKNVRERRRDLANINKNHLVNPESNYCFGEGGAGTYSDGKLYTRSNKRGDITKVLKLLVYHGASNEILFETHPHIGTNKLPQLIENIRNTILTFGGEIHFDSKLIDFHVKQNKIISIKVNTNNTVYEYAISNLILATGHSARDIYELFYLKKILIEAKPFAMGVRVEHPQELIDSIQYHCSSKAEVIQKRNNLPAANYSLVHQVNNYGVYSFCMCPGGIIAPCATSAEQVVTNGWSPSKRNNPYANSGIVVGLTEKDFLNYKQFGPLSGLKLQEAFEKNAWLAGGKTQTAPAQALSDFVSNKTSALLPKCSYQPGVKAVDMHDVLGSNITVSLREGFKMFGSKLKGFITNEALIVGVESRTSTPVRIPRDKENFRHPEINNLIPCGEGAGYAGGIMSAAMDGEACANALLINNIF
ncbi:MAG: FAD-binding protein [Bacteroidetes bacterium]|nr:FAD-binding protein [Bacteroidota bacterium]